MDYLFNSERRFVTAMATGWQWGPAELDPRKFLIVRTEEPAMAAALDDLRARRKMLDEPGLWLSGNVYATASLKASPDDEHIVPPVFINLRTGSRHASEDDAWASASDGDTLFYTKGENDPDCPGVAIKILSVANRQAAINKPLTREEAERWPS